MRTKFLISLVSILGLGALFYSHIALADDVLVDLSVLDRLGNNSSPVINSGPLFPVVKKSEPMTVKPKAARKTQKKKTTKTSLPKAVVKESTKIVVPEKTDIKVEVKTPETEVKHVDKPTENLTAVINSEETASPQLTEMPAANTLSNSSTAPISENQAQEAKEAANNEESIFDKTVNEVTVENTSSSEVTPLIEKEPTVKNNIADSFVSSEILFAADSYELQDADKEQLDNLITTFENPHENKIAIFAFNIDDGKDVFRKKRLALNRAIEIRSYLLSKGYKNYSIKVVNINEPEDKENKVIVEEAK